MSTDEDSLRTPFIAKRTSNHSGNDSEGRRSIFADIDDTSANNQSLRPRHGCCSSWLACLWEAIVHYWVVTTDPTYQTSVASRRPFWMLMFLADASYQTALFLYQASSEHDVSHLRWTNLFYVFTIVVCAFMPYRWKYADPFVLFIQLGGFWVSFDPLAEPCYLSSSSEGSFILGTMQMLTQSMSVGLHAYAGLIFVLFLLALNILYNPALPMGTFVAYTIVVVSSGWMEYTLAILARNLKSERTVNEFLLDHATDGFCSVECATGLICSASPHLEKTVCSCDLIGKRFVDLVDSGDHAKINALLEAATQGRDEMDPVFVSCTQASDEARVTFDAKIITYPLSKQVLRFCLQVQGEFRYTRTDEEDNRELDDATNTSHDSDRSASPVTPLRMRYRSENSVFDNATFVSLDFSVTDVDACSNYNPLGRRKFLSSSSLFTTFGSSCTVGTQTTQTVPAPAACDIAVQAGESLLFREIPRSPIVSAIVSPRRGRSLERSPRPLRPPCLPRPPVPSQSVSEQSNSTEGGHPAPSVPNDTQEKTKKEGNAGGRRKRLGHIVSARFSTSP